MKGRISQQRGQAFWIFIHNMTLLSAPDVENLIAKAWLELKLKLQENNLVEYKRVESNVLDMGEGEYEYAAPGEPYDGITLTIFGRNIQ